MSRGLRNSLQDLLHCRCRQEALDRLIGAIKCGMPMIGCFCRQAMRTLNPLASFNLPAAEADRWFSATLLFIPRSYSSPVPPNRAKMSACRSLFQVRPTGRGPSVILSISRLYGSPASKSDPSAVLDANYRYLRSL